MDENPYKPPVTGSASAEPQSGKPFALGIVTGCAVSAVMAVVGIAAIGVAVSRVDIRENPRHWDEVRAREKARRAADEAQATK